jgi:hypothetical protein
VVVVVVVDAAAAAGTQQLGVHGVVATQQAEELIVCVTKQGIVHLTDPIRV